MTIKDFLLARIAEDEREANICLAQYRRGEGGSTPRWTRQLAECAAKRAIIDVAEHGYLSYLRPLATVYSDHPDYREEWQP